MADHSGETAAGEAATGETKQEYLVASRIVVHEGFIGGEDVLVDPVADGA
jgi:hypothetical protein